MATIAFCSTVSYAATQTSDDAAGTSGEPSVTLSRSIEAGKAVSSRALSSKAKEVNAETAKTEAAKTELTDFQKKMATLKQGEAPSKGKARSDFATKTAPAAKKTSIAKKADAAKAPEAEAEKVPMVEMEKKGTVTGANRQGFALEYGVDKKAGGMEIWFNYGEGMRLGRMESTSELEMGDTVHVVYDQAPDHSRRVKEITLLKKKPRASEEN